MEPLKEPSWPWREPLTETNLTDAKQGALKKCSVLDNMTRYKDAKTL